MKNWLIKKLGGYTTGEYEANFTRKVKTYDEGVTKTWEKVEFMHGVVENDIVSEVKRNKMTGRMKYRFECPFCTSTDRVQYHSIKLNNEVVGTECKCMCGHEWHNKMTVVDYDAKYSKEEFAAYEKQANTELIIHLFEKYKTYKEIDLKKSHTATDVYNMIEEAIWYYPHYDHVMYTIDEFTDEQFIEVWNAYLESLETKDNAAA